MEKEWVRDDLLPGQPNAERGGEGKSDLCSGSGSYWWNELGQVIFCLNLLTWKIRLMIFTIQGH